MAISNRRQNPWENKSWFKLFGAWVSDEYEGGNLDKNKNKRLLLYYIRLKFYSEYY